MVKIDLWTVLMSILNKQLQLGVVVDQLATGVPLCNGRFR